MAVSELGVYTPYSTVVPLLGSDMPTWLPDFEQERISSYQKYDEIYWNHPTAFKLMQRGMEEQPIYVPTPRTIADTTAHYLLKGLTLSAPSAPEGDPVHAALMKLIKREDLYARIHTAKHSGVVRGDWVLHVTADPQKPDGSRINITSVDPAAYFPITDEDDPDKVIAVDLVEQILANDGEVNIRRQHYAYEIVADRRRVTSEEMILKVKDWWDPRKQEKIEILREKQILPERITQIPVYHFKNVDWQGQPFGSSELRGYERVMASVNQSVSDEELALALEGLGVYATDSGPPVDEEGKEEAWEISPGRVVEVATNSFFKRIEGLGSVKPMQDHIAFLIDALYESSATFRGQKVDVQVAESGIALAIKFLPTLAKIEHRDTACKNKLEQMMFDWKQWHLVFENQKLTDTEIIATLGAKLPQNEKEVLNQLNNMVDRHIISRAFYREQMTIRLGYTFPEKMEDQIEKELEKFGAVQRPTPTGDNQSNNANRPNESAGTEATQNSEKQ